jgi:hypothetical protein
VHIAEANRNIKLNRNFGHMLTSFYPIARMSRARDPASGEHEFSNPAMGSSQAVLLVLRHGGAADSVYGQGSRGFYHIDIDGTEIERIAVCLGGKLRRIIV